MSFTRRVCIVGSQGQDGRLLSNDLQEQGHDVLGIDRDSGINILLLADVERVIREFLPSEVYFLAAHHHSAEEKKENQAELWEKLRQINVDALIHFLEAICSDSPQTKIFYAASSHIFGNPDSSLQDEKTSFNPSNFYGLSKIFGISAIRYYRKNHKIFASNGILYNHESSLRQSKFVSKKIISAAVAIQQGRQETLKVGNLAAEVDWGDARDYVKAMQKILAHSQPDDFIIATGQKRTVQDFIEVAFHALGLDWKKHAFEDQQILEKKSPLCNPLVGNSLKLQQATGWRPQISFEKMIFDMLESEGGVLK